MGEQRAFYVRCDLLGSTGESKWSQVVKADSPERALIIAQSMADAVADQHRVARSRITVSAYCGPILLEEP